MFHFNSLYLQSQLMGTLYAEIIHQNANSYPASIVSGTIKTLSQFISYPIYNAHNPRRDKTLLHPNVANIDGS